jgi:uncharacterized protein
MAKGCPPGRSARAGSDRVSFRTSPPPSRDVSWDPFWYGIALWGTLLVFALVGGFLDEGATPSGSWIVGNDVVEAFVVGLAAWRVWPLIRPLFAVRSARAVLSAAVFTVGGFVAIFLSQWGYRVVAEFLGFRYFVAAERYAATGWPLWAMLLEIAVFTALSEEIAFRGVIQGGLERAMSARDAMIVQAAMFSVLHFLPAIFISHFVMGLVFGWVRRRTNSIYPGMVIHASWNALVLVSP